MRALGASRTSLVPGGVLAGPWVRDPLWRRARAVPSLDLRFADNKSLVDAVTGASLVTFTHASSKTVTNSAEVLETVGIDVPAFDHNPTTLESLGLLVEEQRTNLLLRSEEFDDAYWTKTRATVSANDAASPSGTISADKLVEDATASNTHFISRSVALGGTVDSSTYSISVYAKAAERSRIRMGDDGQVTNGATIFDLTAGTASGTGTISNAGSGWYRCTIYPKKDFGTTSTLQIYLVSTGSTFSYTGDGTSGLYLWGAQLEAGAFPTSYIPTTTAAVTRSASLADLISSAIANNIRTLYLEFRSPASGTRGVVSLNDNTANERASVLTSGTDPRLVVVDGGVEQANVNGGTVTANQRTRIAVRINANDFAISINGGAVVTDTSGTLPTVDRLMLGRTQAGEYLNGPLARVTGWTQLLPDSTLQSLAQ